MCDAKRLAGDFQGGLSKLVIRNNEKAIRSLVSN